MNSETSENKVFIENPIEFFTKFILPVTVTVFVIIVIAVGLSFDQIHVKGRKLSHGGFFLLNFFSCIFLTSIFFFVLSLVEKRIITCDSKGFNLVSTNYWNSYHKSESFLWNEISDSEIVGESEKVELVIEVTIKNTHRLLSRSLFSKDAFDDLIQFINRSTPHLPYIWKKQSEVSTELVLAKRRMYRKVART